jgi:integrase
MTRHTFTTISEAVGTPKTMIDRLTNHTTSNDITGGYIHTETETLRQAINKIAAYIQARVNQSEKVIRLYG